MRDLALDIKARDATQAAFDSAGRRAKNFGMEMDRSAGAISRATGEANKLATATDRVAAAGRRALAANNNYANWQRRNLAMQLGDVGQMLALGQNPMTTLLQQGPQIAQIYGPGEGGVGRAFKEMGSLLLGVVTKFPLLTAAVAPAGICIAGFTHEINQASEVTVSMGDTAKAVFQVIGNAIYGQLQPAIAAIAPWFATAWDVVVSGTKTAVNLFIAGWVIQFDALKTGVSAIPDAFIAAGEAAANGFLSAIEQMVRETLVTINDLLTDINGMMPQGMALPLAPSPMSVKFGWVDIGGAAARQRLSGGFGSFMDRARGTASTDYAGQFFDAVKQQAVANSLTRTAEEADKAGKAMKKAANDNIDPWKGLRKVTVEQSDAMKFAKDVFGGFMSDMRNGLKQGEGFWGSLKNAAMNAIDKITDKILNQLLDAMFKIGGPFGGIGGFIGGIFGGFRASGGPVDPYKSYVVGEKGPEILRMGGQGGNITSNGQAFGGSGPQAVHVTVGVDVDASGNLTPFVTRVSSGVVGQAAPQIIESSVRGVQKQMRDSPGYSRR